MTLWRTDWQPLTPKHPKFLKNALACRLAAFSQKSVAKLDMSNASAMLERTTETTQYIVNRLFQLPSEPAAWGRMAHLPAPTTPLPREKPLPKAKPLTRWEKYAKEKGIQKKKKDMMVWDEIKKDWRPRFGYNKYVLAIHQLMFLQFCFGLILFSSGRTGSAAVHMLYHP